MGGRPYFDGYTAIWKRDRFLQKTSLARKRSGIYKCGNAIRIPASRVSRNPFRRSIWPNRRRLQHKVIISPPDPIEVPPLHARPPRPLAALRWLSSSLLFPWGLFFIALAVVAWNFLTPDLDRMVTLEPDQRLHPVVNVRIHNLVAMCLGPCSYGRVGRDANLSRTDDRVRVLLVYLPLLPQSQAAALAAPVPCRSRTAPPLLPRHLRQYPNAHGQALRKLA